MPQSVKTRRALSKLALTTRYSPDDTDALAQLRAELRACGLEDRIREEVAKAPPISVERAIEIADLLVRGAADHQRGDPAA
jgi:hypothetical protein